MIWYSRLLRIQSKQYLSENSGHAMLYWKFTPNITQCNQGNQPKSNLNVNCHSNHCFILSANELIVLWDYLQISLLTLNEFNQIN